MFKCRDIFLIILSLLIFIPGCSSQKKIEDYSFFLKPGFEISSEKGGSFVKYTVSSVECESDVNCIILDLNGELGAFDEWVCPAADTEVYANAVPELFPVMYSEDPFNVDIDVRWDRTEMGGNSGSDHYGLKPDKQIDVNGKSYYVEYMYSFSLLTDQNGFPVYKTGAPVAEYKKQYCDRSLGGSVSFAELEDSYITNVLSDLTGDAEYSDEDEPAPKSSEEDYDLITATFPSWAEEREKNYSDEHWGVIEDYNIVKIPAYIVTSKGLEDHPLYRLYALESETGGWAATVRVYCYDPVYPFVYIDCSLTVTDKDPGDIVYITTSESILQFDGEELIQRREYDLSDNPLKGTISLDEYISDYKEESGVSREEFAVKKLKEGLMK